MFLMVFLFLKLCSSSKETWETFYNVVWTRREVGKNQKLKTLEEFLGTRGGWRTDMEEGEMEERILGDCVHSPKIIGGLWSSPKKEGKWRMERKNSRFWKNPWKNDQKRPNSPA